MAADWSRAFDDPIQLPDGGELRTLRDAGNYIAALSPAEHEKARWRIATLTLLMAAEGRGPIMHARIGMLRAINGGRPKPAPAPRRKSARAYRIIR